MDSNYNFFPISNDLVGAQTVTDELFPADSDGEEGAELDGVVTQINLDLVDDYPASDPRWAESVPDGEEGKELTDLFCLFHFYRIVSLKTLLKITLQPQLFSINKLSGNHLKSST